MYARSTTIDAQRASMDAGIAHVRDQVLPALQKMDGFVGLSMLVDRDSSRCIATSAWTSEDAMRESSAQVGPVRNRAAEILGGVAEVQEWEIAVMHRDHRAHQGACVRSGWVQANSGRIDAAVDIFATRCCHSSRSSRGSVARASW